MDTRVYLTLGFTFLVGCFSGAYLYVTVFAPQFTDDGFDDPSEITFRLQGQMYGGCVRSGGCASFELLNNRRYTYSTPVGEEVSGRYERDEFNILIDTLLETNFSTLAEERNRTCRSFSDGIDYRYNVIIEGEQFELDTCGTVFGGSRLDATLLPLWDTFSTTTPTELPYILEQGMTGAAQDAIDNLFQYDEKRETRQ